MRLPGDQTALGRPAVDPTARFAWLLATTRLTHPDASVVSRSGFVERLRALGVAADASRVSRWESGQQAPSPRQLEAYEEILDLPQWSLVILQRTLTRLAGQRPGRLDLAPRRSSTQAPGRAESDLTRELETLIAAAITVPTEESERLSAVGWIRLADVLAAFDVVYLDRSTWVSLSRRLLSELTLAIGFPELQLYEAAAILCAHPVAGRHLVEAMVGWLDDPAVQEPIGVIATLAQAPGTVGSGLLESLFSSSAPHPLLGAAEMVAADMLARGEDLGSLDPSRTPRLEKVASTRLGERAGRPMLGSLQLAIQLPHPTFARILDRVTDAAVRARLSTLNNHRLLVPQPAARRVARSLARTARDAVPGPGADLAPDPLLERLIMEAVFGVNVTLRWQAGSILALSPYAASLVESCLDLATGPGSVLGLTAWRALHPLDGQHPSPRLVEAALAETRPLLRHAAMDALSRSPTPLGATTLDQLVASFSAPGADRGRHAMVATLARHSPVRLGDLTPTSAPTRDVIRWWQAVASG